MNYNNASIHYSSLEKQVPLFGKNRKKEETARKAMWHEVGQEIADNILAEKPSDDAPLIDRLVWEAQYAVKEPKSKCAKKRRVSTECCTL